MRRVGGAATVQWRYITFTFETRIDYSSSVGKTETFVIMTTHGMDKLGKEDVLGQVAALVECVRAQLYCISGSYAI